MREIKFRGRSIIGEWQVGSLVVCPNGRCFIGWGKTLEDDMSEDDDLRFFGIEVIPETVGQFTGLSDKNSVEIYEGDIARVSDGYVGESVHEVKYFDHREYPAFDLEPSYDEDSNSISAAIMGGEIEVIGNIHDNPELLEVSP